MGHRSALGFVVRCMQEAKQLAFEQELENEVDKAVREAGSSTRPQACLHASHGRAAAAAAAPPMAPHQVEVIRLQREQLRRAMLLLQAEVKEQQACCYYQDRVGETDSQPGRQHSDDEDDK